MPAADGAEIEPPSELTSIFEAFVLARELSELLGVAMAGGPMRPMDYAFASVVEAMPGASLTEHADRLGVPLTTASDWLAAAVAQGWVEVRPGVDRRRREPHLTETGLAAFADARERFGAAYLGVVERTAVPEADLRVALRAMVDATRATRAALEHRQR